LDYADDTVLCRSSRMDMQEKTTALENAAGTTECPFLQAVPLACRE